MLTSCSSGLRTASVLVSLLSVLMISGQANAQCQPQWFPLGVGVLQTSEGSALMQTSGDDLILGGQFAVVGNVTARGVARWDGTAWHAFGPGLTPSGVDALTLLPNGDLVAGGAFTHSGTVSVRGVGRWDGNSWQEIGGGLINTTTGGVRALATLPNGDLVVGGGFADLSTGAVVRYLVRWNGTSWSALGNPNLDVRALTVAANGDLIVAGRFTAIGGIAANRIARWDGTTWSSMGTALQPGMDDTVHAVAVAPGGDVLAVGDFTTAGATSAAHVARWNGTSWSALASGLTSANPNEAAGRAVAVLTNGDVVVGGHFSSAGGLAAENIARWDGTSWHAVTGGTDHRVRAIAPLPNGDFYAAGQFAMAGNMAAARIARHNSCAALATPFGSGCTGSAGFVGLTATNLPRAGTTFVASASGMSANSLALAVNGFTPLSIPLPVVFAAGVAGCTALVSPDVVVTTVPSSGLATTQVALPNAMSLLGTVFHQQVAQFDFSTPSLAITTTNGLSLTVGI